MRLLYASQSSFGGLKTVLLKKVELIIAVNSVFVYTVHHCIKPESPSDLRCFIVILASK